MESEDSSVVRRLLDHPLNKVHLEWLALRRMHYALAVNEGELRQLIERLRTDPDLAMETVKNVGDTSIGEEFFNELVRRLVNYLASVGALIDHSRNLMRNYPPDARVEYQRRVEEISKDGASRLIGKLRDYALHYAIPPIRVNVTMTGNEASTMSGEVLLDIRKARKFKEWPAPAKAYLAALSGDVLFLDLVAEYSALLNALYDWMYAQFPVWHREEIADYNSLRAELPPRKPLGPVAPRPSKES